jgi:RNA polymerase sigma-70 factor (ECF subfamily)
MVAMLGPSIEDLYRRHAGMVLRRARQLVGDDAAEDIVHEVFIRAARSWVSFRGQSSITTWLYRITTNQCLNHIRDEATRRLRTTRPPPQAVNAPATEDRLGVNQLLQRLPVELREVAVYYYVDQMDQREIAQLIGVSERTVRNRLQEFLSVARDQLQMQRLTHE